MPFFSIIIPVFNISSYLNFCLESILNQVFTDYECILIDDGSTDDSPKICDDYSLKDNRIKVIHKKNGGLSDARNTGIITSTGNYIVLLDGDDSLSSIESLLNLSKIIGKTSADVIFNSILITFFDNIINSSDQFFGNNEFYYPNNFYKNIMHNNKILLTGWQFILKRDFLLKNNLFFKCGLFHEDELWMPYVICSAYSIAINHYPFYSYRLKRENSIMSELNPKRIFDRQLIIDELLKNKINISSKLQFIFTERCIDLWYNVFNDVFHLKKEYNKEKEIIFNKLNEQKYILLHGKKIKYYFYFLLIFIFGLQHSHSIIIKTKKYFNK
jgi:glycosyltransferase involved in cell wall biosynthesis